jgi:nicotinate-nucleotide pyrophosphorylase (carboxylating)
MILIKDNHVDASGSITNAVNKVRKKWGKKFKIEVETRNLKEVEEALSSKVERIMLDNMNYSLMKKAVKLINKSCEVEISGNMTLKKVRKYSKIGADFVSIGELTHTIEPFDFSLKMEK